MATIDDALIKLSQRSSGKEPRRPQVSRASPLGQQEPQLIIQPTGQAGRNLGPSPQANSLPPAETATPAEERGGAQLELPQGGPDHLPSAPSGNGCPWGQAICGASVDETVCIIASNLIESPCQVVDTWSVSCDWPPSAKDNLIGSPQTGPAKTSAELASTKNPISGPDAGPKTDTIGRCTVVPRCPDLAGPHFRITPGVDTARCSVDRSGASELAPSRCLSEATAIKPALSDDSAGRSTAANRTQQDVPLTSPDAADSQAPRPPKPLLAAEGPHFSLAGQSSAQTCPVTARTQSPGHLESARARDPRTGTPPQASISEKLDRGESTPPSVGFVPGTAPVAEEKTLGTSDWTDKARSSRLESPSSRDWTPAYCVDRVLWPSAVIRLALAASPAIEAIATKLESSLKGPRRIVGFASGAPAQGTTTLMLAVARHFVLRGENIVLVDAAWHHPVLCQRLGVIPEAGWEAVLAGRLPVPEVTIRSEAEPLLLLPWLGSADSNLMQTSERSLSQVANELLQPLAEKAHFVFVDIGSLDVDKPTSAEPRWEMLGCLTGVIGVWDVRRTDAATRSRWERRVELAGGRLLGTAENFVLLRKCA
ncbi:MAG: hypothetical protein NZ899_07930 [Thermoguttaceae bacterium]|nr:hypothetical protein [Thermoguttaceae bacterium]MDW8078127.1 hypothetical protein [Thermoguttaceae bacterium]